MSVVTDEIRISRGANRTLLWTWTTGDVPDGIAATPVDMTGAVGTFAVRVAHDPSSATLLTQAATLDNLGNITVALTPTQTLSVPEGTYPCDLFITFPTTTVTKFLSGSATFS